jgi:hypothetical protein
MSEKLKMASFKRKSMHHDPGFIKCPFPLHIDDVSTATTKKKFFKKYIHLKDMVDKLNFRIFFFRLFVNILFMFNTNDFFVCM